MYRHEALIYRGIDEFIPLAADFIDSGLRGGEAVLVVLDEDKIDALRDTFGPDDRMVTYADMTDVGANPARIIGLWQHFLDDWTGGPVRESANLSTRNARRASSPSANCTNRY